MPGDPAAVLAYVDTHPPVGGARVLSGRGTGGVMDEGFAWPAIRNVLGMRWLVIEAVPLAGGGTGVRADAQVVWLTPRPASERIAPGARRLRVTVQEPATSTPRQGPIVVSARRKIRRVVRLLNSLPAAQPGSESCPNDAGVRVRLAFSRRRGAAAFAVALVEPGGCQEVRLTLHGRRQPLLSSAAFPGSGRSPAHPLIEQIERALGLSLAVGPR